MKFLSTPSNGFLAALLLSSVLAYPIYLLLLRIKAQQVISKHLDLHQGKVGTPTMGGWIFVVGFIPVAILAGVDLSLVSLFAFYTLIGFLDDFVIPKVKPGSRGLDYKPKLILQVVGAAGYSLWVRQSTTGHLDLGRCAWDVFFILLFSNAYNFTDGVDGLAFSVGMMLFAGLAAVAIVLGYMAFVLPLAVLAGAMMPFGYMNAPKAKIFMGDTGSMPVGAIVGAVMSSMLLGSISNITVDLAFLILSFVMLAELIPPPLQIFWVKRFKKRLFPMTPIHHAFEKQGWKEGQIDFLFAGVQACCSALAVLLIWRFH